MSVLGIVLLVLAVLLLALFAGGYVANRRRYASEDAGVRRDTEEADRALAEARAGDRGWDRPVLEEAVRAAWARRSSAAPRRLELVQVLDRPGTDDDECVFRVVTDTGSELVHLGRRDGAWVPRA